MPYTPPHKRLSGDAKTPTRSSPAADSLADRFSNSLRFGRSRRPHSLLGGKVNYAPGSTSLWWPVGSRDGDEPIPVSFRLERIPGAKHLVLCRNPLSGGSGSGGLDETPWETIAERIKPHLFACVQRAIEAKTTAAEGEEVKLSFLARVGKVHFKECMISLDLIRLSHARVLLEMVVSSKFTRCMISLDLIRLSHFFENPQPERVRRVGQTRTSYINNESDTMLPKKRLVTSHAEVTTSSVGEPPPRPGPSHLDASPTHGDEDNRDPAT